jgi:hypothetical protein
MSTVLLEARSFRPFKSSEEYLVAMKEDLAEWLQTMYPSLNINVDNFMEKLETGVTLCEVSTQKWTSRVHPRITLHAFPATPRPLLCATVNSHCVNAESALIYPAIVANEPP